MIRGGDIAKGTVLLIKGTPYLVVEREFVNPGKGSAFARCKMKNLRDGSVLTQTIKTQDNVEDATVSSHRCQYQYDDGDNFIFMDNETYEQLQVPEDHIGDSKKYLKENMVVQILLHDGRIIGVDIPAHVELEVVDTPPAEKGNTAQGGSKPATLETGAVVNVPFFISNGDKIRVDTRSNEYLDRV